VENEVNIRKSSEEKKSPEAVNDQHDTSNASQTDVAVLSSSGRALGQGRPRHLLRQHPQSQFLNNPRNQRKHHARMVKTRSYTSTYPCFTPSKTINIVRTA